jgi:deazaflavin-dependent oxidoreductase (nitroreductase family)
MDPKLDRRPAGRSDQARVLAFVGAFNSIVTRLARRGIPMGPNALLTVRGRRTGLPRTTPVAVIAVGGRRWIQCPFGEVNWVRNLRAVGEGTLTTGRREEAVRATELSRDQATAFFEVTLAPYIRRRRAARLMAGVLGLGDVLNDPAGAAERHPVFELTPTLRSG